MAVFSMFTVSLIVALVRDHPSGSPSCPRWSPICRPGSISCLRSWLTCPFHGVLIFKFCKFRKEIILIQFVILWQPFNHSRSQSGSLRNLGVILRSDISAADRFRTPSRATASFVLFGYRCQAHSDPHWYCHQSGIWSFTLRPDYCRRPRCTTLATTSTADRI